MSVTRYSRLSFSLLVAERVSTTKIRFNIIRLARLWVHVDDVKTLRLGIVVKVQYLPQSEKNK